VKYRKRPIVVDAWQYLEGSARHWPNWVLELYEHGRIVFGSDSRDIRSMCLRIGTLEGGMNLLIGNWLVKGIKGEIYPVADDVFKATYDPVTEPETTPLLK
jgi:hypothetical protein